ncbi:acyl-CoA dehydrogenase NM domain-like protein [Trametes gibbosa]|nr:acyl-CoA dehydrogenase NM domain-like protein [Trametes gibbosa]
MRVDEGFQQPRFPQEHPYTSDAVLSGLLKRIIPAELRGTFDRELTRLGDVLVEEIRPISPLVQAPTLTQYNEWGQRVDDLRTSEGWRKLEEFAVREGYNAVAYERKYGEHSRAYMFARTMVMTGDCHVIMCPMGMTDGSTRSKSLSFTVLLELFGTDAMKKELLPHFLSHDPKVAYLSGQWMTEKPGGSDVSLTETRATPTERIESDLGDPYILEGFKWFSSAAEGNMSVALARTGEVSQGSRGLSLFVVPLRMNQYPSPLSNGVHMHRLKQKVGTHGVPTAELSLNGTRAWRVGPLNQGVKAITPVLNITRIHSAIHSIGSMQRALSIARSYAAVRSVNSGRTLLKDDALHVSTLADLSVLYRALVHLTFGGVHLLGKTECGTATAEESARLRLLTPTIKGFAAERAASALEECMAALGGQGYMEEVGIGRLIRDAMVEKIWEGTINILALDLSRAVKKEPEAIAHWCQWARKVIAGGSAAFGQDLSAAVGTLAATVEKLPAMFRASVANPSLPRIVMNYFGTASSALYLLEHATWSRTTGERSRDVDAEAFRRWMASGDLTLFESRIADIERDGGSRTAIDQALVYGPGAGKARL